MSQKCALACPIAIGLSKHGCWSCSLWFMAARPNISAFAPGPERVVFPEFVKLYSVRCIEDFSCDKAQLLQWAEFLLIGLEYPVDGLLGRCHLHLRPSHLICQGDQTPSSRGRLKPRFRAELKSFMFLLSGCF